MIAAAQEGDPLPQSVALPVAALAAHIALCVWQEYRRLHDARRDKRLADQLDRIEERVNELSSDRTQAAAAVTRLFAVNREPGGDGWEEQGARRSR